MQDIFDTHRKFKCLKRHSHLHVKNINDEYWLLATFNNISVVSWTSLLFVGRKPPTCRKSLTFCTPQLQLHFATEFELAKLGMVWTDCLYRYKNVDVHQLTIRMCIIFFIFKVLLFCSLQCKEMTICKLQWNYWSL